MAPRSSCQSSASEGAFRCGAPASQQSRSEALWVAHCGPNYQRDTQMCSTKPLIRVFSCLLGKAPPYSILRTVYLHGPCHGEQTSSFKSSHANVWHLIQTLHGQRTRNNRFWFLFCLRISSALTFNIYELEKAGHLRGETKGRRGSLPAENGAVKWRSCLFVLLMTIIILLKFAKAAVNGQLCFIRVSQTSAGNSHLVNNLNSILHALRYSKQRRRRRERRKETKFSQPGQACKNPSTRYC